MGIGSSRGKSDGSGSVKHQEGRKPRFELIDREQLFWCKVDVERLIGEDHTARAIWEFVGNLDLSGDSAEIRAVEGMAGRPAFNPQLFNIRVWIRLRWRHQGAVAGATA